MDFSFTEEQTLLQESIERFIQNDYSFDDRQKAVALSKVTASKTGRLLQS